MTINTFGTAHRKSMHQIQVSVFSVQMKGEYTGQPHVTKKHRTCQIWSHNNQHKSKANESQPYKQMKHINTNI